MKIDFKGKKHAIVRHSGTTDEYKDYHSEGYTVPTNILNGLGNFVQTDEGWFCAYSFNRYTNPDYKESE